MFDIGLQISQQDDAGSAEAGAETASMCCGIPAMERREGNQTGRGDIGSIYDQSVLALCGHQATLQSYHSLLCAV